MADRRPRLERLGSVLRAWLGPATEIMLDMAKVGPGHRVLDVAAGAGDQTLQAAERVGPTGHVLATDISPNILAFAERTHAMPGTATSRPRCWMARSWTCRKARSTR